MNKSNIKHYRWIIAGLIFFITLVNFIDRSAISFVIGPLKQEFHFTDTQFGIILAAFGLGYMLLTAFGGWLVDRLGARLVWPLAAITWSLCVGLLGFASGFLGFIMLRFLLGVTEGPHFPAMSRSISNWLPPSERAKALSLGLVAIPLSAVIGAPITSYLVADFGWRVMFMAMSAMGIIWAFVWYVCFRDNPADSKFVSKAELKLIETTDVNKKVKEKPTAVDWRFILTNPTLIANNIAYFAYGYMLFFMTLWLPGYFLSQHGLDLKSVGWYLTIPWLIGAAFLKLGGILSDWLYKKTGSLRIARSHVIWCSQLIAAFFFMALGFTESFNLSLVYLSLGLGFGQMSQPAFFSVNIDVAKERSGAAQGVTSSCLAIAGILGPILTGLIVDFTGNYKGAFFLLAGLTGIAVLTVVMFHRPDREWSHAKSTPAA
jgi:ACS family hexuronate transporter-like MFS transporter